RSLPNTTLYRAAQAHHVQLAGYPPNSTFTRAPSLYNTSRRVPHATTATTYDTARTRPQPCTPPLPRQSLAPTPPPPPRTPARRPPNSTCPRAPSLYNTSRRVPHATTANTYDTARTRPQTCTPPLPRQSLARTPPPPTSKPARRPLRQVSNLCAGRVVLYGV